MADVWIKSGANHSGDGPGYGEHFERPDSCDGASDTDEPSDTYDPYGSALFAL